jgi:hypothetical protein
MSANTRASTVIITGLRLMRRPAPFLQRLAFSVLLFDEVEKHDDVADNRPIRLIIPRKP